MAVGGAALLVPVLRNIQPTAPGARNPNGIALGLQLAAGLGLLQAAAETRTLVGGPC